MVPRGSHWVQSLTKTEPVKYASWFVFAVNIFYFWYTLDGLQHMGRDLGLLLAYLLLVHHLLVLVVLVVLLRPLCSWCVLAGINRTGRRTGRQLQLVEDLLGRAAARGDDARHVLLDRALLALRQRRLERAAPRVVLPPRNREGSLKIFY